MKFLCYYPRAMVGDGGPTVAVWTWCRALANTFANVAVVYDEALSGAQPLAAENVPAIGIRHHGFGRWRVPRGIGELADQDTVILVHSAFLAGNLWAAREVQARGGQAIFVPHGAYESSARQRNALLKKVWLACEGRVLQRSLAIHAFVDTEQRSIREVAKQVPIITAPTPIRIPQEHWRGGGGYAAWFGRYDIEHKGLDLLISAYKLVPEELRIPLRLRGRESTHGRAAVQSLIDAAGLSRWISAGPSVEGDEKTEFLCHAEFFVMPSRWESFSIALLEVLALGVPCLVSSRMPIAGQLAEQGACRVTEIDPAALSSALTQVLKDPESAWVGCNPRKFAEVNLSDAVVARSFVKQVDGLIARRGA